MSFFAFWSSRTVGINVFVLDRDLVIVVFAFWSSRTVGINVLDRDLVIVVLLVDVDLQKRKYHFHLCRNRLYTGIYIIYIII